MKFRLWTAVLACSVWVAAPSAQAQRAVSADYIVALVNSQPVTNAELRMAMQRTTEQLRLEGQAIPAPAALRETVLERLINEKVMLDYAQMTGVRIDDSAIDQAEQAMARQSQLDVAGLRQRMENEGVDAAALRNQLRDQLIVQRLRERDVDSRVRVPDQEVDRYIAEQLASIKDPLLQDINIAQILLAVPENAAPGQLARIQAEAQHLQSRARGGEDFAALVREYSAADRLNGGQLGLRRGDRYPALFIDAIRNLPVGAVSDVVRSGAGFHILKVVERRAPAVYVRSVQQTRVRHILLRTGPALTQAAAIRQLNEFRQNIQSGKADFAELARNHSQDSSADTGGDLGWISPGLFVPEFEVVMNRLAPGELSEPVVSRFGVHLIQTLDRRRTDLNPREVREAVRDQLRAEKAEEAYQTWVKDLRERAYVEMRDSAK